MEPNSSLNRNIRMPQCELVGLVPHPGKHFVGLELNLSPLSEGCCCFLCLRIFQGLQVNIILLLMVMF